MRNVTRVIAVVGLWAASWHIASGQVPAVPPLTPSAATASRLRWIQYQMVAGRIVATANATVPLTRVDRRRERLQIQISAAQVSFRFEIDGTDEQLVINLVEGNRLSIKRTRKEPKYELRFEQTPDDVLWLTVSTPDDNIRVEGDSFWHLYLADPDLVAHHLVPILELLRPSWQLSSTGAAIEDSLVQRSSNSAANFDRQNWTVWIDDLADTQFSKRQAAERELLDAGPVIVPYLQNLDREQLDAEQEFRIRRLIHTLLLGCEDSADRVATWLVADEQVWMLLLARDEPVKRRVAVAQLSAIRGEAIDFDPEAAAPLRAAQLEKLQSAYRAAHDEQ